MAAKPRAKPKPKGKLHTWAVNVDGAVSHVQADACVMDDGVVAFYVRDTIVRAVGPAHWATVELVEPQE